jgi:hypothetical protein
MEKPKSATDKHLAEFARTVLRLTFNGSSYMDEPAFKQDMPLRHSRSAAYVESRFPGCAFHAQFAKDVNRSREDIIMQLWTLVRDTQKSRDRLANTLNNQYISTIQKKYAIKVVRFSLVNY